MFLVLAFMLSIVSASFAQAVPAPPSKPKGSFLSELGNFTSSLSTFFGDAMHAMTQAIGYLTGGVQAASLFQTGTNIINGMVVNGPKPPNVPLPTVSMPGSQPPAQAPAAGAPPAPKPDAVPSLPSGNAPATSGEKPDAVAGISQDFVSDSDFSNMLQGYQNLAIEEKNILNQMKENPNDASMKEIYNQIQTTKLEKSSKIMASLNYDIEKKQFTKLNLLLEYINTNGPQTVKIFGQIVDSARGKLQFCLIEAKKFGLVMDIQIIEGKLKLVMSLTTGNFIPSAPPASEPMSTGTSAAPATAPASTSTDGISSEPVPAPPASTTVEKPSVKPAKKAHAKKTTTTKKPVAKKKTTAAAETK